MSRLKRMFLVDVTVHGLAGDWSIFRREDLFCEKTSAENMDLSPSSSRGGQSHFRGKHADWRRNVLSRLKRMFLVD